MTMRRRNRPFSRLDNTHGASYTTNNRQESLTETGKWEMSGYYNFIRPHMALRFGSEIGTPAMQAGLVDRKLTFRDVFTAGGSFFPFVAMLLGVT